MPKKVAVECQQCYKFRDLSMSTVRKIAKGEQRNLCQTCYKANLKAKFKTITCPECKVSKTVPPSTFKNRKTDYCGKCYMKLFPISNWEDTKKAKIKEKAKEVIAKSIKKRERQNIDALRNKPKIVETEEDIMIKEWLQKNKPEQLPSSSFEDKGRDVTSCIMFLG